MPNKSYFDLSIIMIPVDAEVGRGVTEEERLAAEEHLVGKGESPYHLGVTDNGTDGAGCQLCLTAELWRDKKLTAATIYLSGEQVRLLHAALGAVLLMRRVDDENNKQSPQS